MEWISVKNRLPILETDDFKHYKTVDVIAYDGSDVFFGWFSAGKSSKFWCEFKRYGYDCNWPTVTHWMPLPKPPED